MLRNLFPERAVALDDTQMVLQVVSTQMVQKPENDPLGAPWTQIGQNEKNAGLHLRQSPLPF
jgi:hypothetical protein